MSWGAKTMEEQRLNFITAYNTNNFSFSDLCRQYGISRKTGYKWLERYENEHNLSNHSKRPKKLANKTTTAIENKIVELRTQNPAWGAKKLYHFLASKEADIPCIRTFNNILQRHNLILPEESLKRKAYQRFERSNPNELWQADFKGDVSMEDGNRCYPLVILDDHSRYSLEIEAKTKPNEVQNTFYKTFKKYGLPDSILTDNGCGFTGFRGGHIKLELWLMEHDVLPIHGRCFHPQTQGKVERFNRSLKSELLSRVTFLNLVDAQEKLSFWQNKYNFERPHEALGYKTPSKLYVPSPREYTEKAISYEYEPNATLRRVNGWGSIRVDKSPLHIGSAYIDKWVKISYTANSLQVCYRNFIVAEYDLQTRQVISKKIKRITQKL